MTYLNAIDKYSKILVAYFDCIPEKLREKLSMQDCSDSVDELLSLLCDKFIDNDDFSALLIQNMRLEFYSDYRMFLSADDVDIDDITRKKLLKLCVNAHKTNINDILFSESTSFIGTQHFEITDDGYLKCDKKLASILNELSQKLYIYDEGFLNEAKPDDVHEYICDAVTYYVVPQDSMTAKCVSEIMGAKYLDDFIKFCKENHIAADTRIKREYDSFVKEIKMSFTARLYRPYRHICGEKINILDYRIQNGFSDDFIMNGDYENVSDDILLGDALRRFLRNSSAKFSDVIELLNDNRILHYAYMQKDDDFEFILVDGFTVPLFNEDDIWAKIRCFDGQIKSDGTNIYIPQELSSELNPDEYAAVINILKQQQLNVKKQYESGIKQTLSAVLDKARSVKALNDKIKDAKDAEKAEAINARGKNNKVNGSGGGN